MAISGLKRAVLYSTIAFASGCSFLTRHSPSFVEPNLLLRAEQIRPYKAFRRWWREIEDCSGLTGDFDKVRWFHMPSYLIPCESKTGLCDGLWVGPHDIYLPDDVIMRLDFQRGLQGYNYAEIIVKHEMLHYLVGFPGHPDVFRRCHVLKGF